MPPHILIRSDQYRATIPAIEAILREPGNRVERPAGVEVRPGSVFGAAQEPSGLWAIWLARPPAGIIVVRILGSSDVAIRMADEPEYPGEAPAAWHERGEWTPCPAQGCGRALLWAEAGYVPGYRVCAGGGHFARLTEDGRSAEREGTVRAGSQYPRRGAKLVLAAGGDAQ